MRNPFKGKNPLASLFTHSRREDYLVRYVLREHAYGRPLSVILEDPYVLAWSTPTDRRRLLERPELVAALGEQTLAELRRMLAEAGASQLR
jgi:hypothetical protein